MSRHRGSSKIRVRYADGRTEIKSQNDFDRKRGAKKSNRKPSRPYEGILSEKVERELVRLGHSPDGLRAWEAKKVIRGLRMVEGEGD